MPAKVSRASERGAAAGTVRLAVDCDGVMVREADMAERSLRPESEHTQLASSPPAASSPPLCRRSSDKHPTSPAPRLPARAAAEARARASARSPMPLRSAGAPGVSLVSWGEAASPSELKLCESSDDSCSISSVRRAAVKSHWAKKLSTDATWAAVQPAEMLAHATGPHSIRSLQ
eukprot:scaffold16060_cov107-Isochrysis_galbana.AAC.7